MYFHIATSTYYGSRCFCAGTGYSGFGATNTTVYEFRDAQRLRMCIGHLKFSGNRKLAAFMREVPAIQNKVLSFHQAIFDRP